MKSDLYPATAFGDWDVVTVLEEMESEGMVVQHTKAHENQVELAYLMFLIFNSHLCISYIPSLKNNSS